MNSNLYHVGDIQGLNIARKLNPWYKLFNDYIVFMTIIITKDETFEEDIKNSLKPVIVDLSW